MEQFTGYSKTDKQLWQFRQRLKKHIYITFVYGLEIAAHCDFLVRLRYTNTLTYLLTPVTVT